MSRSVYLDYNATTPLDSRVADAMLPVLVGPPANAASPHGPGRAARRLVDSAREQVAGALDCGPGRVVFVSGATESISLAIKGLVTGNTHGRRRVVVFATEHKAVLDTVAAVGRFGFDVVTIGVDRAGMPDLDALADTLDQQTLLVSMMAANNETGVLGPIERAAELAHSVGALFHTDATQALGKIDFSFRGSGADLASVSSHKVYGPQGIGALVATREAATRLRPLIDGGGHESGLRSGTLNTAGCVGFGAAADLARIEWRKDAEQSRRQRDRLEEAILGTVGRASVNGGASPRLPGTSNIRFAGVDADAVMLAMPEIAVSTGSACSSAAIGPSHVLLGMGLDYQAAGECLRYSVGRMTTDEDVELAVASTVAAVEHVRSATRVGAA